MSGKRKKPRVKYKFLIGTKNRGGFALLDLKMYYEAACLGWMKEWMDLKDAGILDLKGFVLVYGWQCYLYYDKAEVHKGFSNMTPCWISPMEAVAVKK